MNPIPVELLPPWARAMPTPYQYLQQWLGYAPPPKPAPALPDELPGVVVETAQRRSAQIDMVVDAMVEAGGWLSRADILARVTDPALRDNVSSTLSRAVRSGRIVAQGKRGSRQYAVPISERKRRKRNRVYVRPVGASGIRRTVLDVLARESRPVIYAVIRRHLSDEVTDKQARQALAGLVNGGAVVVERAHGRTAYGLAGAAGLGNGR